MCFSLATPLKLRLLESIHFAYTFGNMASARLKRERDTIRAMFEIYCQGRHGTRGALCPDCQGVLDYAFKRIDKCPYAETKPTCKNCVTHCYAKEMQTKVKEIMRFSGPRMPLRHPILTLGHYLDELKQPRRKAN